MATENMFDSMVMAEPDSGYVIAPSIDLPRYWDDNLDTIQELTSGALPDAVAEEITRRSAESAAMRGLGVGQTSADLTLRDLGVSSYQSLTQGLALGIEAGKTEATLQGQQAQLNLQAQQANLQARQTQIELNQKWQSALMTNALGQDQLGIAAAEAYSENRARRLDAELNLVALNADLGTDIQAYLDAIGGAGGSQGYFDPSEWIVSDVMERQNINI